MPGSAELLDSFRSISNDLFALAVLWHACLAAGVIALSRGRVSVQRAGQMLAIPVASVCGVAFAYRNPFNGVVFAILALALVVAAQKMPVASVQYGPRWAVVSGVVLIAFGWAYPEFVEGRWAVLFAAPFGLLPCPTLSLLIGATMLLGGLGSRAWSLALAAAGLFYGLLGATRLGVRMDGLLALGAAVLGTWALVPGTPAVPRRRAAR